MDRPRADRRRGEAERGRAAGGGGWTIEGANVESAQLPKAPCRSEQHKEGRGEESGDDRIRDGMTKMRKSDRVINCYWRAAIFRW